MFFFLFPGEIDLTNVLKMSFFIHLERPFELRVDRLIYAGVYWLHMAADKVKTNLITSSEFSSWYKQEFIDFLIGCVNISITWRIILSYNPKDVIFKERKNKIFAASITKQQVPVSFVYPMEILQLPGNSRSARHLCFWSFALWWKR